jgi:hypothetical protein
MSRDESTPESDKNASAVNTVVTDAANDVVDALEGAQEAVDDAQEATENAADEVEETAEDGAERVAQKIEYLTTDQARELISQEVTARIDRIHAAHQGENPDPAITGAVTEDEQDEETPESGVDSSPPDEPPEQPPPPPEQSSTDTPPEATHWYHRHRGKKG